MRVVLATDALTAGGVGRHLRDLADGLAQRAVAVGFAAPAGSRIAEMAAEIGVGFRTFEDGVEAADIWHLHLADTYYRGSLALLGRARRVSRRVVITEHLPRSNASDASLTTDRRTPGAAVAKTVFKRGQLSLAHSVITVSDGSRQFLLRRYGLPARKVITIHNGVNLTRFVPKQAPPAPRRRPTVVAVGSLIKQKGHDVLIRAAADSPDWDVVVAGTGPQQTELQSLAERAAPGRVHFAGWVDDIPGLMRTAAAICLPSRWESFAYVPLEAMAMGLPLVATRVDGVDEVVTDGRSGLLVAPEHPGALSAALDHVVGDADLSRALSRSAREDVAAFGVEPMVDKTLTHYRSLL